MVLYQILLVTGALGLIAMALLGFVQHGGHDGNGHGGAGGHASHSHAAHGHVGHADGHLGHGGHHGDTGHLGHHAECGQAGHPLHHDGGLGMHVLALLSPMTLFSACLGAGVVGSLLTQWNVPEAGAAAGAGVGAIAFNALLVRPMMRLVMGFASVPARGLGGALMQRAEAVTAFDANGEGLVRVLVDGQSIDVLARLTDEERSQGTRVLRGQPVRIEDVDARTNRCTVSRL